MVKLLGKKILLRDMIESDIDTRIHWEEVETEWQLFDAPWEDEAFDKAHYLEMAKQRIEALKTLGEDAMRYSFQIVTKEESQHIGWCNSYCIDENFQYTSDSERLAIGIDIPPLSARRKGYATEAWLLFIRYLLKQGIKELYTQTWSGNTPVLGLIEKVGFEEVHRLKDHRYVRGKTYDALTFKLDLDKFHAFYKNYSAFIK